MSGPRRVLCLHSFRTSGAIMREQMFNFSNFGERLESAGFDLEFVNAPYRCSAEDEKKVYPAVKQAFPKCKEYFEWYNASEDKTEYHRLDETLAYLDKVMAERGPFDGIVGFSQGGTLAHLVAHLQATGAAFARHPPLKFTVIIASRRSRATAHQQLWAAPPPAGLPRAMVFYGGRDKACPPEEVKLLMETLPGVSEVYLPQGDHKIPNLADDDAESFSQFLQEGQPSCGL